MSQSIKNILIRLSDSEMKKGYTRYRFSVELAEAINADLAEKMEELLKLRALDPVTFATYLQSLQSHVERLSSQAARRVLNSIKGIEVESYQYYDLLNLVLHAKTYTNQTVLVRLWFKVAFSEEEGFFIHTKSVFETDEGETLTEFDFHNQRTMGSYEQKRQRGQFFLGLASA
jgi:Glu-tRNA(Gln) amidotransferase subunit E-like FAD-binding protein